jgi:dephospho-CoA kinase
MKILGLTGSIGMGKSTASKLLRRLHVPTHSSDDAVHELLSPHGEAFHAVIQQFPEAYDSKTKKIDRQKLGQIVFVNAQKRRVLENILHPLVQKSQQKFILKARRMGIKCVALDIPLLFETNAMHRVHKIITVTAPFFVQKLRVLNRTGFHEQKFYHILKTQMPDRLKQKLSDFVVPTGLGQAHVFGSLQKILERIGK